MKKLLAATAALLFALPSARADWAVDLNTAGAIGSDPNQSAYFFQNNTVGTGTGVIDPFLTVDQSQTPGIYGYNNDQATPDNPYATFGGDRTHLIQLTAIPVASLNGVDYREFLLDANQLNSDPAISLVSLQLYTSDTQRTDLADIRANGTLVYDLDATGGGGDGTVTIHTDLQQGSGNSDAFFYIKNSLFTSGDPYVYLYAQFSNNNDGFEEFSVSKTGGPLGPPNPPPPPPGVPAPPSLALALSGLVGAGFAWLRRCRRPQAATV